MIGLTVFQVTVLPTTDERKPITNNEKQHYSRKTLLNVKDLW